METLNTAQKFFKEFQPPQGFLVPKTLPIARGGTVYIKAIDRTEQALASGIMIPTTSRTYQPEGYIYAVGPKVNDLQPGMRVIYNMYANSIVYSEGVEYLMISEIDVFGIMPNENDMMFMQTHEVEKRKQYSHDEMPNEKVSKHEMEEIKDQAEQDAEFLIKDTKARTHIIFNDNEKK